jgi:hypothetical protein
MRILERDEFLKLPAGTVYYKTFEGNFWDMAIKKETDGIDDWKLVMLAHPYMTGFKADFQEIEPDSEFEHRQQFAVLDDEERCALISALGGRC